MTQCTKHDEDFADIWQCLQTQLASSHSSVLSLKLCGSAVGSLVVGAAKAIDKSTTTTTLVLSLEALVLSRIPLWSSAINVNADRHPSDALFNLFLHMTAAVLRYGATGGDTAATVATIDRKTVTESRHFRGIFNGVFLCLALCVCVYEVPQDLRSGCLQFLEERLQRQRDTDKATWTAMLQCMGSDVEELFMRSVNLAFTNLFFLEKKISSHWSFSYGVSATDLWKIRVYSPMVALRPHHRHESLPKEERLSRALRYVNVEAVIQLTCMADVASDELRVQVDNVRCEVVPFLKGDEGTPERHFPSKLRVEVGPLQSRSQVLSVSAEESSNNPVYDASKTVGFEGGFEGGIKGYGLKFTASEGTSTSVKCWRMEQMVHGSRADYEWSLHDPFTGKEVASSRPSVLELLGKTNFVRDRYTSASSPFTQRGGVLFSAKEYPACFCWKMMKGWRSMVPSGWLWEVSGSLWVTYWPNKHRTSFSETLFLPFSERVTLQLPH